MSLIIKNTQAPMSELSIEYCSCLLFFQWVTHTWIQFYKHIKVWGDWSLTAFVYFLQCYPYGRKPHPCLTRTDPDLEGWELIIIAWNNPLTNACITQERHIFSPLIWFMILQPSKAEIDMNTYSIKCLYIFHTFTNSNSESTVLQP